MNRSAVSIRPTRESDIPHLLAYWYGNTPGFLESIGVDLSRLPRQEDMQANLLRMVEQAADRAVSLVIEYEAYPIGIHLLNQFDGKSSAVFHAHIWQPKNRGKGFASASYPLALREFFRIHKLEKIVFKTPAQNIGAIRVKERLGLTQLREEIAAEGSLIKAGTKLRVYEVTPEIVDQWQI